MKIIKGEERRGKASSIIITHIIFVETLSVNGRKIFAPKQWCIYIRLGYIHSAQEYKKDNSKY